MKLTRIFLAQTPDRPLENFRKKINNVASMESTFKVLDSIMSTLMSTVSRYLTRSQRIFPTRKEFFMIIKKSAEMLLNV